MYGMYVLPIPYGNTQ